LNNLEEFSERMAELAESGAITVSTNDSGEDICYLNLETLERVEPELFDKIMETTASVLHGLQLNGLVENIHDDIWDLTERGKEYFNSIEEAFVETLSFENLKEMLEKNDNLENLNKKE
jgi:hypothetical protein